MVSKPKKTPSSKQNNKGVFQPKWRRMWQAIVAWWRHLVARTPNNPHHAFRMTKPKMYRPTVADLRSTWSILKESWQFTFGVHKRILLGLGLLYAVVAYVLVGGISQVDYVTLKDATLAVIDTGFGAIGNATTLFGAAISGNLTAPASDVQQFLSAFLTLFFWLALVWASRMLMAGKEITMRDALYNSGAPIIPTLATLAIVAVQLVPAALGIFGYTIVANNWANSGVESMMFALAAAVLVLMSLYFVVSSLIALVIVSLPGTYPWQALREARAFVMGRRWNVVLRVLLLVLAVLVAWAIVLIPAFLLDNWLRFEWLPLIPLTVQLLIGLTLVYTSVYIYKLYRSLL